MIYSWVTIYFFFKTTMYHYNHTNLSLCYVLLYIESSSPFSKNFKFYFPINSKFETETQTNVEYIQFTVYQSNSIQFAQSNTQLSQNYLTVILLEPDVKPFCIIHLQKSSVLIFIFLPTKIQKLSK